MEETEPGEASTDSSEKGFNQPAKTLDFALQLVGSCRSFKQRNGKVGFACRKMCPFAGKLVLKGRAGRSMEVYCRGSGVKNLGWEGRLMAQSVECLDVRFNSGHDLGVGGSGPMLGSTLSRETASDSLSLFPSSPPQINLKRKKTKRTKLKLRLGPGNGDREQSVHWRVQTEGDEGSPGAGGEFELCSQLYPQCLEQCLALGRSFMDIC